MLAPFEHVVAAETLSDVTTPSGIVYRKVKIIAISGDNVTVVHEKGMATIPAASFDTEALARAKSDLDAKAKKREVLARKLAAEEPEREARRKEQAAAAQEWAAMQQAITTGKSQGDGNSSIPSMRLSSTWEKRARKGEEGSITRDLKRIFADAQPRVDLRGNARLYLIGTVPFLAQRRYIESVLRLGSGTYAKHSLPGFPEDSFHTYTYGWNREVLSLGATLPRGSADPNSRDGFETITFLFDQNSALVAVQYMTPKIDGAGAGASSGSGDFFLINVLQQTTRFGGSTVNWQTQMLSSGGEKVLQCVSAAFNRSKRFHTTVLVIPERVAAIVLHNIATNFAEANRR